MDGDDEEIERRAWRRHAVLAAAAVLLLVVGAAGGAMWSERRSRGGSATQAGATREAQAPALRASSAVGATEGAGRGEETVEIVLTPDAIERAGIKIAEVKIETATAGPTGSPTLTSNAYRC